MARQKKGETLDEFLSELGEYDEVHTLALKKSVALQFEKALKSKEVSKAAMAKRMRTSRTQVDRVLDPSNVATSIETLQRAAAALGKSIRIKLVDA